MKNTQICPKRSCNRILHVEEVADRIGDTGEDSFNDSKLPGAELRARSSAWRLARKAHPSFTLFRGRSAGVDDTITGLVEAYLCRRCGFTEFYTHEPESIDVDGKGVRELEGPKPEPFPMRLAHRQHAESATICEAEMLHRPRTVAP